MLFSFADSTLDEGVEERISAFLDQLPREQQHQSETLRCPDPPTWTPLVSRYFANVFDMGANASGISLEASRINHSCCPNAFCAWNGNLARLTLHALMDISAGGEVTDSYEFPSIPLAARQKRFCKVHAFECDCPACDVETESGRRGKTPLEDSSYQQGCSER